MKILYLITKGSWGGAQRYVFDLATSLPTAEYKVSVAVGEGEELKIRLQNSGIRVIALPGFRRDIALLNDLKTLWRLVRLLRQERLSVVHLNSSKAGGIGALAARLARIPRIIFTVHGFASNEDLSFFQKIAIRVAEFFTILLSHTTICVSHADAASAARLPFCRDKIKYIPLGIVPISFLSKEAARKALGISDDKPIIGTIAELTKNKGLSYAIEAMRSLPNLRYLIIGDGEERCALAEAVRAANLQDRVFFVGHLPDAARLLNAFTVFLLPSLKEGLPYVLLEAGLAGLPVVASRVGGIPDLIKDGETGLLVSPKNPTQIAERTRDLFADTRKQTFLAARLTKEVTECHTLVKMCAETFVLYGPNRGTESETSF